MFSFPTREKLKSGSFEQSSPPNLFLIITSPNLRMRYTSSPIHYMVSRNDTLTSLCSIGTRGGNNHYLVFEFGIKFKTL